MTYQALKTRFLKSSSLFQYLLLVITVISLASCEKDEEEQFYFDAEAQKVKDEAAIRKYFRANNVDTTAVVRTESGLYYLEVTEGNGAEIKAGDMVEVHYVGRLTSNVKFDSSYDRGKAFIATIQEGEVIDGWVEGLPLMRVGGEGFLYIPSHLAYGPYGTGSVPPSAVLVFEINVLSKK